MRPLNPHFLDNIAPLLSSPPAAPRANSIQNSLANAELFMAVPNVLARFDLELFESDVWDTETAVDAEHHAPRVGSNGLRVYARQSTY